MLAKGNRSKAGDRGLQDPRRASTSARSAARRRLAQDCIKKVEVLEYPELGMEAVWKIEVKDFPAFIVVDDKGNDFFAVSRGRSRW
jgi:fumarate hydratase class I